MKRILLFVLAVGCLLSALALPFAAEPLPQNALIATAVEEIRAAVGHDTAGAAVVLFDGGTLQMAEGFGYADLGVKALVTPETVFEIGDISAVLVAISAYRMAELGLVSLTADIATYLPAEFVVELGLSNGVTLQQLLLGTAGFEGRSFDLRFESASDRFGALADALLAQVPQQVAPPDTFYAFSPFGITLAAYVLECAADMPYAAWVKEQILAPLGMHATVLDPNGEERAIDVAKGYTAAADGAFTPVAGDGRTYAGLWPANGALSTADDMARLLSFLLDGNTAVMSEESRAALLQTHFADGIFTLSAPGLKTNGTALGCRTATGAFGASFWFSPDMRRGAVVLTNTPESRLLNLPQTLCNVTFGVGVEAGGELPALDVFAGAFAPSQSEDGSFVGRLLRREQSIEITQNGDGTLLMMGKRLTQIAPGVFAYADGDQTLAAVQFVLNDAGDVERVVTAEGDCYLPLAFYEYGFVADFLLGLLIVLSCWLVLSGAFALRRFVLARGDSRRREERYRDRERGSRRRYDDYDDYDDDRRRDSRRRYDDYDDYDDDDYDDYDDYDRGRGRRPATVFTIPTIVSLFVALSALLQLLIAFCFGASSVFSLFGAMSVITVLLCVAEVFFLVLAFIPALTKKKMPGRIIRRATVFLLYMLVLGYWGIIVI